MAIAAILEGVFPDVARGASLLHFVPELVQMVSHHLS
jgi:hypothetical protein